MPPSQLTSLFAYLQPLQVGMLLASNPTTAQKSALGSLFAEVVSQWNTRNASNNPLTAQDVEDLSLDYWGDAYITAFKTANVSSWNYDTLAAFKMAQIAALTAAQVAALTPLQLASLTDLQFSAIEVGDLPAITTEKWSSITTAQINALANIRYGQGLPSFGTAQVAALTVSQVGALSPDSALGPDSRLPLWLASGQISALSTATIKLLPWVLTPLTGAEIGIGAVELQRSQAGYLNTVQIASLSSLPTEDLSQLSISQIAGKISSGQLTSLFENLLPLQAGVLLASKPTPATKSALASLFTEGVAGWDARNASIAALTAQDVEGLKSDPWGDAYITAYGTSSVSGWTSDTLAAFSASQIGALDYPQIAALTTLQLAHLTTEQFSVIEAADLPAIGVSKLRLISSAQIGALTNNAVWSLTTEQVAALTVSQLSALRKGDEGTELRLANAQISALSTAAITLLPWAWQSNSFSALSRDHIMALAGSQLSALTEEQFENLVGSYKEDISVDQIAGLLPAKAASVVNTLIDANSFGSPNFSDVPLKVSKVSTSQLTGFSSE